jgi:carbamoyl-phosphate synthase large subunit
MDILITSASRKVPLVRAFQRALSEEGGGRVITIDANPRSAALYVADKSYIIPPGTGKDFIKTVRAICRAHDIRLIVPTRDEELPIFADEKESFLDMSVIVMVPEPSVIQTCQDKHLFIDFCMKNGFCVPKTYSLDDLFPVPQLPLFIRGRFGKGSKTAFRVDTLDELKYFLKKIDDPVIQECIDADEYTIDLFADFKGNVISVIPRKRLLIFGGESFVGMTSKNWTLINEAIRLAKALNLTGHNTIQCFLKDDKVLFIEVNPRYGGGANLGFAAGAFTPHYLVQITGGKPLSPHIGDFKDQYLMLRYTDDIFLNEKEVQKIGLFDSCSHL